MSNTHSSDHSNIIYPLSTSGLNALLEIAHKNPLAITACDPEKLKHEMQQVSPTKFTGDHFLTGSLNSQTLAMNLSAALRVEKSGGPKDDVLNAHTLRIALPRLTRAQAMDPTILASITCFHMGKFPLYRWQSTGATAKLALTDSGDDLSSDDKKKLENWVLSHFLGTRGNSKNPHTTARLFWLYEFAESAEPYSEHHADFLLELMAGTPSLYHSLLSRPSLMASDELRAAILDEFHASGVIEQSRSDTYFGNLIRPINLTAAVRSIELFDDSELRELVRDCLPDEQQRRRAATPAKKILSLGAGTQSTVMALMADKGDLPRPDVAIFADTGWEPPEVYEHLEWLKQEITTFDIEVVRAKDDLSLKDAVHQGVNLSGSPWLVIPVWLRSRDGEEAGMNWRQCTNHWKVSPINQAARRLLSLNPRQKVRPETSVEMWLGITTDEAMRVKTNPDKWIINTYPLLGKSMSRQDCIDWFNARYPKQILPKSACIGCPYHSSDSWLRMREQDPTSFASALETDALLRDESHNTAKMFNHQVFLHHRRMPLAEAVDMDAADSQDDINQFINDCSGLCGV